MIPYYIVQEQLDEAARIQAYLLSLEADAIVTIIDASALLTINPEFPMAIIMGVHSITNDINYWIQQHDKLIALVCCGTNTEIETLPLSLPVFAFIHLPLSIERIFSLKKNIAEYFLERSKTSIPKLLRNFVFVKSDYKLIRINLPEILFLSGLKDYTQVFLKGKKTPLTTLKNLKEFESVLSENQFIRVHRSYIVSINQIDCISKNEIVIEQYTIPIGNAYRKNLDDAIDNNV